MRLHAGHAYPSDLAALVLQRWSDAILSGRTGDGHLGNLTRRLQHVRGRPERSRLPTESGDSALRSFRDRRPLRNELVVLLLLFLFLFVGLLLLLLILCLLATTISHTFSSLKRALDSGLHGNRLSDKVRLPYTVLFVLASSSHRELLWH